MQQVDRTCMLTSLPALWCCACSSAGCDNNSRLSRRLCAHRDEFNDELSSLLRTIAEDAKTERVSDKLENSGPLSTAPVKPSTPSTPPAAPAQAAPAAPAPKVCAPWHYAGLPQHRHACCQRVCLAPGPCHSMSLSVDTCISSTWLLHGREACAVGLKSCSNCALLTRCVGEQELQRGLGSMASTDFPVPSPESSSHGLPASQVSCGMGCSLTPETTHALHARQNML